MAVNGYPLPHGTQMIAPYFGSALTGRAALSDACERMLESMTAGDVRSCWIGRWMDGRMDGWMDGWMKIKR